MRAHNQAARQPDIALGLLLTQFVTTRYASLLLFLLRFGSVMEVFTFVRMGGDQRRILVLPTEGRSRAECIADFRKFDVRKAECSVVEDQDRLLAIIESGFGSFDIFNNLVREIFPQRVSNVVDIKALQALRDAHE